MTSLLAGLAGILFCANLGAPASDAGLGMEMGAIAGVVIGGASIKGGKGTILGGILGALFLALAFSIMGIGGIAGEYRMIANGVILILAVYTDVIIEQGYFSRIFGKIGSKSKGRSNMSRIFFVAIFVITLSTLVYIGSRDEKGGRRTATGDGVAATGAHSDELYIMATMYSAHPVLKPDIYYFHEKGRALGVQTKHVGPAGNDLVRYVADIREAIAQKPDGLAINGLDPAIVSLINEAMEKGIPVVLWDADLPQSKRITFIGTDWPQLGVRLAEAMAPLINRRGKVGRLGNISQPHIMAAMEMFKIHMKKIAPDVEVLDISDDEGKIDVAARATNHLIQRYPDIAGIAGFDGSSGGGICPTIKALGEEGRIKVVINDLTTTHIKFLKEGTAQYVSGQKRNIFGPLALQVLFDINHQKYAFTSSIGNDARMGLYQAPDTIDTGFIDVTRDTVEEFEKAQQELLKK
jgi:ABC-type sugar transport system substrate-binding protein